MKAIKTAAILLLAVCCIVGTTLFPVEVFSAGTVQSEILFHVDEPEQDGTFYVTMTVYNASFNTYQFALKYNTALVKPIDSNGAQTSVFQKFAVRSAGTENFSTIGTSIDSSTGLIEFAGYVTPGSAIKTDGLQQKAGYAVIGSSGLEIYRFRFMATGSQKIGLGLATKAAGDPYAKSLPEGGALFDAGASVPATIRFELPATMGESFSIASGGTQTEVPITKAQRLQNTIALQIGNYGAAANGALIRIDPDNSAVRPYIDDNDRTMMPVRFVAERLGAVVEWNGQTSQVTIRSADRTIVMTIGTKTYTINGVAYTMDTEPIIVQGWDRTVVPIRFVSEALGRAVEWDAANQLVLITDSAEPWQVDRDAEKQATQSILLVISDLVRDFT